MSIKDIKIDCKKINLFIGKPNVGKSNIIEALSLFSTPYGLSFSNFIRFENTDNLFFDRDLKNEVSVITNIGVAYLRYHFNNINAYDFTIAPNKSIHKIISQKTNINEIQQKFNDYIKNTSQEFADKPLKPLYKVFYSGNRPDATELNYTSPIKKYDFAKLETSDNKYPYFLVPPNGNNLFSIVYGNNDLRKQISPLFDPYNLEFVLKVTESKFEIQKKHDGLVYSYPYTTIADTLQRFIFYISVIYSNKNSVLVLEEPEVHSFPPYTRILADKISRDKQNQYFITTHSPYLLQTIIENTDEEDLNVFITYFENFETKVRALTHEELRDIQDDSIDIFFNLDRFLSADA